MQKYRIMTFDGGGIRGALTAHLLKKLDEKFPQMIKNTNLFAGTSTGSFIALGLAYGLSCKDLIDLYSMKYTKYIFSPKYPEMLRPKYNNEHLKHVLTSIFPRNLRLKDLKHQVLIPTFSINEGYSGDWGPIFYNNFPHSPTKDAYVIDVALSSSAAPVYFSSNHNHIDGGVIANNPSTAAIAMARDENGGNQSIEDMYLLSIGTGFNIYKIKKDTTYWGALEWFFHKNPSFPLLNILFDGGTEANEYFSKQLLRENYFRLNPKLNKGVALDDYTKIPYLLSVAEKFDMNSVFNWVETKWL